MEDSKACENDKIKNREFGELKCCKILRGLKSERVSADERGCDSLVLVENVIRTQA